MAMPSFYWIEVLFSNALLGSLKLLLAELRQSDVITQNSA